MTALESGATLTMVRRGGVTGPGREQRRARELVEDSRGLPTQPYAVMNAPTATTLLTPRTQNVQPQFVVEQPQQELLADGSSLRFLTIGLALGVILAFLLSGHNLIRLRTSIGMAILPASAIQQLQQQALETNGVAPQPPAQMAPRVYAATAPMQAAQAPRVPTQFQPVAQFQPATQFQPVARTPVSNVFPIPEVDVQHLPKHTSPAPRQASRPRSGGSKAASAPSDEAAAPFDARTIEASLKD